MPKAKRRQERTRRELLFCNTQPVVGGWLTTTVELNLVFTRDKDVEISPETGAMRPPGVDVQGGAGPSGMRQDDVFPGDTFREPAQDPDWLREEAQAFAPEPAFEEDEGR